jgi:hypothetical protein
LTIIYQQQLFPLFFPSFFFLSLIRLKVFLFLLLKMFVGVDVVVAAVSSFGNFVGQGQMSRCFSYILANDSSLTSSPCESSTAQSVYTTHHSTRFNFFIFFFFGASLDRVTIVIIRRLWVSSSRFSFQRGAFFVVFIIIIFRFFVVMGKQKSSSL